MAATYGELRGTLIALLKEHDELPLPVISAEMAERLGPVPGIAHLVSRLADTGFLVVSKRGTACVYGLSTRA